MNLLSLIGHCIMFFQWSIHWKKKIIMLRVKKKISKQVHVARQLWTATMQTMGIKWVKLTCVMKLIIKEIADETPFIFCTANLTIWMIKRFIYNYKSKHAVRWGAIMLIFLRHKSQNLIIFLLVNYTSDLIPCPTPCWSTKTSTPPLIIICEVVRHALLVP